MVILALLYVLIPTAVFFMFVFLSLFLIRNEDKLMKQYKNRYTSARMNLKRRNSF